MLRVKANVPSRKKIKLPWFKSKAELNIDRKVEVQYTANSVTYNKHNYDVNIKYILLKEGDPKDLPSNSPMTLYKGGLPFLFLSTSATIGNKIISEELIDADIVVDDDIVEIREGKPEITFEDAIKPKEHVEVRTRYDKITRKITIENKLDNEVNLELVFKQTKDVSFVKSDPIPTQTEEPLFKYKLSIPSEESKKILLELQAKIVSRVTKVKPEYAKEEKSIEMKKKPEFK